MKCRLIALYLPQFHPIPENDEWWGKGFTEWTNTAKAKPLFRGHYQPNVPADLGFYDLRLPEAREAQADLAREYGVEAFCYYHYWFGGRRLLERPFEEVLNSGRPDFPFCLCWANQTWSGIWHGAEDRILMEQTYPGMEDHKAHFEYLLPAFRDPRYLRVEGKPLFMVYNPDELPASKEVTDYWRQLASQAGLPGLHLVAEHNDIDWDPREHGFDAVVQIRLPPRRKVVQQRTGWSHPFRKLKYWVSDVENLPTIHKYDEVIDHLVVDAKPGIESYPCVIPGWDNTPRSGANGMVLQGSTPDAFQRHLRKAIKRIGQNTDEKRIVFIKSWNEWAEGNYLEPDLRHGRAYLEVLRKELDAAR